MPSKMVKDLTERIERSVEREIKDLKSEARSATGTGIDALEALGREYETAKVKIFRKNTESNRFELFAERESMPFSEILETGYDSLCKYEGERGDYKVEVVVPAKEPGKKPTVIHSGLIPVGGDAPLPISRTELARRQNEYGYGFNPFSMMAGGLPTQNAGKNDLPLGHIMKYMSDATKAQTEMGAAQQGNFMNLVAMMMFKDILPGAKGGDHSNGDSSMKAEIAELKRQREEDRAQRAMEDRIRQQDERIRESERRSEERHREMMRQLDNKCNSDTIEMLKLQQASAGGKDDAWLRYMAMTREDNSAAQQRHDALMMKMFEKPDGADQMQKVMGLMMESSVNNLNVISQVAASGLAGGSENPWVELLREGVGTVREGMKGLFAAKYGIVGEDEEEDEALPQAAPPAQIEARSDPALPAGAPSEAQTTVAEPGEGEVEFHPEGVADDPDALKKLLLSDEELEKLEHDGAMQPIFQVIDSGDFNQATARIFGHARAGRSIPQRWMMAPGPISAQILSRYGLAHYMIAMGENIVNFIQFMDQDGDPNEWSDEFKPIKPKKGPETMKQPAPPTTEFGVTKGAPVEGEKVDASKVPEGIDPALAEQQREERRQKAVFEKMMTIKENLELLQAGKISPQRAQVLRKEELLPPKGTEEQALAEINEVVNQLEAEVAKDQAAAAAKEA